MLELSRELRAEARAAVAPDAAAEDARRRDARTAERCVRVLRAAGTTADAEALANFAARVAGEAVEGPPPAPQEVVAALRHGAALLDATGHADWAAEAAALARSLMGATTATPERNAARVFQIAGKGLELAGEAERADRLRELFALLAGARRGRGPRRPGGRARARRAPRSGRARRGASAERRSARRSAPTRAERARVGGAN